MPEILLVNPHSLEKVKMAKRRMPAALRAYWAKHRRGNPHKRHRRHHARRANPHYRHHRRRHRNPSLLGGGGLSIANQAKAGLVGALGGLGLDFLWYYSSTYLPASVTAPSTASSMNYFGILARALGAVLIGVVGNKVLKGKGAALATGAMTVVIHDALKLTVQNAGIPLAGLGSYVGPSPVVAYGAPAVGYPMIGTGIPMTNAGPNASHMGVYASGYEDGTDGTDW